eukprot:jgi/Botrbrau1/2505/Bobra.0226s0059.1
MLCTAAGHVRGMSSKRHAALASPLPLTPLFELYLEAMWRLPVCSIIARRWRDAPSPCLSVVVSIRPVGILLGLRDQQRTFIVSNPSRDVSTQDAKEETPLFKKLLVANRGEIACRIMRTASRLGIKTVAVYSSADADAPHTRLADEAVFIGEPPAAQSYLVMDKILQACEATGADAVAPGYGFLSENANFARALEEKGITFVGPPVKAIEAMGDKIESKAIAKAAGVNTIPGYPGEVIDSKTALKLSKEIGFPVMLKASAGGGGKGMRIAWKEEEVEENFNLSTAEALSSFGDGRMLIEKYIEQPRHIEIQVLGDKLGNTVWLPERECSIQRRNQKVIEEAPSTFLDPPTRKAMGEQAVALCKAVGYYSAGTLEFMVDKNRKFYFLEMNTRLQVEHPITESITGLDLVEQMFRVAAGKPLDLPQEKASQIKGWALEARVYAEDPARGYLPSIGRLRRYVEPRGQGVRVDSGVEEGSEISMYYDPLISKTVTYAPDRKTALERMYRALDEYVIRGLTHNIPLLRSVMTHPDFISGDISTYFLKNHYPDNDSAAPRLMPLTTKETSELTGFAALLSALSDLKLEPDLEGKEQKFIVSIEGKAVQAAVRPARAEMAGSSHGASYEVEVSDAVYQIEPFVAGWNRYPDQLFQAFLNGDERVLQVLGNRPRGYMLQYLGAHREVTVDRPISARLDHLMPPPVVVDTSKIIASPMPGSLISLAKAVGDDVEAGDEIAVVEAMKMRNVLRAERSGRIKEVLVQPGAILAADQILVRFE